MEYTAKHTETDDNKEFYNDGFTRRSHYIGDDSQSNDLGHYNGDKPKKKSNRLTYLYFPFAILWMELFVKLSCGFSITDGALFTCLFTIPVSMILTTLCTLTKSENFNRGLSLFFTTVLSIWYNAQVVYYNVFGTFLIVSSIVNGGTGQALNSIDMIMTAIQSQLFYIIMIFIPLAFSIVTGKLVSPFRKSNLKAKVIFLLIAVLAHFSAIALINIDADSANSKSHHNLYYGDIQQNAVCEKFGLFTLQRLDITRLIFGYKTSTLKPVDDTTENVATADSATVERKPQIIDTDFKELSNSAKNEELKTLFDYFDTATPSYTNAYTGMFKDYNVIFITAEALSSYAIDKELTPTLYKMYSEGFQFENFYSPAWGVSTTDGEYANLIGNIPKSGVWSFSRSAENNISFPFTLGEQARTNNVEKVLAYHNHTFDYYDRDKYLANIGYDYKAIGKGLDLGEDVWPNSDLKMLEKTVDDYINADSFSVYYMTVSGHGGYSYNTISQRNFELVEHLDYSDEVKGYLAANIELDRAMKYLLDRLEKAGKLDNTLICITDDHYPYSLDEFKGLDELAGHEVDQTFERYENAWLLWSGSMKKPVKVDTYCSSLDILPTMLNMLGLEYDSRTIIGTDVFGKKEPFVVFGDRSWISQNGKYDSSSDKYTKFKSAKGTDDISALHNKCNNMFTISRMILDNNAYTEIYGDTHYVGT